MAVDPNMWGSDCNDYGGLAVFTFASTTSGAVAEDVDGFTLTLLADN